MIAGALTDHVQDGFPRVRFEGRRFGGNFALVVARRRTGNVGQHHAMAARLRQLHCIIT